MPYEIAYNSDLIIRDKSQLSTLAVFYDRILLPYATDSANSSLIEFRRSHGKLVVTALAVSLKVSGTEFGQVLASEFLVKWQHENNVLFQEHVLERISKAPSFDAKSKFAPHEKIELYDASASILASPSLFSSESPGDGKILWIWTD